MEFDYLVKNIKIAVGSGRRRGYNLSAPASILVCLPSAAD